MDKQFETDSLEILKDEKTIKTRIGELAIEIDKAFLGEDIVVIGVLKGAFIFLADLVRALRSDITCDFLGTSDYAEESKLSGEVKITLDLNSPVKGKNVLLVEDIASDALSFRYIYRNIESREPKVLKTCCFIKKEDENESEDFSIDFIGFKVSKKINIVGYGIDYEGRYRNLPYVARLEI